MPVSPLSSVMELIWIGIASQLSPNTKPFLVVRKYIGSGRSGSEAGSALTMHNQMSSEL